MTARNLNKIVFLKEIECQINFLYTKVNLTNKYCQNLTDL